MRKIGIFGGTFDPVHEGHLYLAGLAREALELDEVWFLPCRISPHKSGRPPSSGEQRARWLRLALEGIPWAKVDETELERDGVSYSYETMEALAEREPDVKWYWIMGGDQWRALPGWKHPERLSVLVEFIVLARGEGEISGREGYRLHVVRGGHGASSTAIREALAAGDESIEWLPAAVRRDIRAGVSGSL